MQAVFTIVAKNYIPLANVLGDSLRKQHPDTPFFIVVADREDGLINFNQQRYPIIAAENLGVERLIEMAFKYNVTEFCTALKPFCFKYFFRQNYQEVIYFDPDIYIYDKLDKIYLTLQSSPMVLTPHFSTVEIEYSGLFKEGNILFAGIFNLGFCALSQIKEGRDIIDWWCNRLTDQCFADRTDGLHVDQKWADFLPTYFNDITIEKDLGYNVAVWNWHERLITVNDGNYYVTNRITGGVATKLIFYHFSNYHFKEAQSLQAFIPVQTNRFVDVDVVSQFYATLLIKENIVVQLTNLTYSYATYDNGETIVQFHRRFYRRLVENNKTLSNPFITLEKNSYYNILKRNKLLVGTKNIDKLNEESFVGFDHKLKLLNFFAYTIKAVIGFERYALLCKFMYRYVRPENQMFLIKGYVKDFPFVNENRYINVKK